MEGPLLVLAGPGSGKTRVITYRIASLIDAGVAPRHICAITFTNKAAEEMRERAMALGASGGAHISTFHSLCVRILRQYAERVGIKPNFSIYDAADQARCIKQAVKDCQIDTTNFPPARMLDAISALKNQLISVQSLKESTDDFFSNRLAKIYACYQDILAQANALDFDDLLVRTAELLRNCPDVCAELGERFRFLLVDEYQDTNRAQYVIAKALVSAHNNICVAGDPDQSIYRWRGADIRNILAFEEDWPNATIVKLQENFRSTPNILAVADKLIANNEHRKAKILIPTRPAGPEVVIQCFEDETAEAEAVANQVRLLIEQGGSAREIGVFYRVNSASAVLEEAFIRNNIPYQIVRGVEFYNRKEIRDLLAYLKVLVNPADEGALLRIINTPRRGIGKTTIDRLRAYADSAGISLYEALRKGEEIGSLGKAPKSKIAAFVDMVESFRKDPTDSVASLAERVYRESGLAEALQTLGEGQNAIENVDELINGMARYDRQAEEPSLVDYLQQIALFSDADTYEPDRGAVALMTLHAAKGLEFENVFIVGLEDGLLPHERSSDDLDQLEEERRLFFVGITRAKTGLYISYARYRTIRGQMLRTIPSQFLYELGVDLGESEQGEYYSDTDEEVCAGDQADLPVFTPGQLVRHDCFGLGRVVRFIDMGGDSIVVVRFNTGQTKSLMLKYANLSAP